MVLEQKVLLTDTDYKLTRSQSKKWITYAVVREFLARMPWEGAEEKKQKQGTNNARLAYVLHIYQPDYERMKKRLAYTKELDIWHKHWGRTAFTIELPNEKSPQGVKTKYIQMVQMHGSVQLSMGAVSIEGMMIHINTSFMLRLLPGAGGKPWTPTTTLVREVFSLMEINEKKVWICLSMGSNGMSTGYFSSVVEDIKEHGAAFVLQCPGVQVYWWLCRRGCIAKDINCLIRHCFTLSQQQKVTKSKYLKDLGHAAVDQSNADDIINAASTQGIYDLTLGLSEKERQVLVAGKAHKASAITYGEAKEGAVEAHNFLSKASVTTIHSSNERKRDAKSVATAKTLAKLVYSINTSKVTEDRTEDENTNKKEESDNDGNPGASKKIAIEGMQVLVGTKKAAMLFETALTNEEGEDDAEDGEEGQNEGKEGGESDNKEKADSGMGEDQDKEEGKQECEEEEQLDDSDAWAKINETMTANMAMVLAQLNSRSEDKEEGGLGNKEESFDEKDMSIHTGDHNLSMSEYNPNSIEVSLGIFYAEHSKKYETPNNFLQALWNAVGPSVGSMLTQLNLINVELEGDEAGVDPDFSKIDAQLIDFLIEEAGENIDECIAYIDNIIEKLNKFKEGKYTEADTAPPYVGKGHTNKDAFASNKQGGTTSAGKTQGPLPRASEVSLTGETSMETARKMVAGDKEGAQSMSMAQGG